MKLRQGGSEAGEGGGPFSWTCRSSSSLRHFGFIASIDHSFLGAAGKNCHDDRNELISFMSDLYHNQWTHVRLINFILTRLEENVRVIGALGR